MRKELRNERREQMGTEAWIRFDDGFPVRPCRLTELSRTGARIVVDAPYDVAGRFRLLLSRDASPGRSCRIKWRRGAEIGAEFVGSKTIAGQGSASSPRTQMPLNQGRATL